MNVIQLVKYYDPSQGGMESVVKNIVEGVIEYSEDINFTVYSNSHRRSFAKTVDNRNREVIIKEATPVLLKSQPLNVIYSSLKGLVNNHDIIHHHYPFPTMEVSLLRVLKTQKHKKLIITWHANIKNSRWSWIEKIYNPLIFALLNRADYIVVTSPKLFESSDILRHYESKVKVIPLCFDPRFIGTESRKFPENRPMEILFVGKLRKYKGVEYLIAAVNDLPVKLTIVGNGEELDNLITQANAYGAIDRITFLSNVDDDQLCEIYKKCDLFVLPSINEAEAFGVVQLEAMSNGLPVINTNLDSGVPYVSLHECSGLTVEPKNSIALKKAIEIIIADKALYELYSSNAIKRSKEFSREKMASSYLELYRS